MQNIKRRGVRIAYFSFFYAIGNCVLLYKKHSVNEVYKKKVI